MNKEKLVGMIIKKGTYKDTKPVQADILRKKQEAVNVSIAAISQILKDDYNAEAKLYAVRYLKDCFEKGNEQFIAKVESKILPILVKMVKDSQSETEIIKYAGSYTKSTELEQFKSIVTSLFTMSRQCIEKWAVWIPSPSRQFVSAQRQVAKVSKSPWKQGFSYFRQENEILFKQNCQKNGVIIKEAELKGQSAQEPLKQQKSTAEQKQKLHQNPSSDIQISRQKQKYRSMSKITSILESTRSKIQSKQVFGSKQMSENEAKFNAAVNQYIEEASQFDEHYLENKIDEFQKLKGDNLKMQEQARPQPVTKSAINKESGKVQNDAQQLNSKQMGSLISASNAPNNKAPTTNADKQQHIQSRVVQNGGQAQNQNNHKMSLQTNEAPKNVVVAPKESQPQSNIKQKQIVKSGVASIQPKSVQVTHARQLDSSNGGREEERVNFEQSDSQDMIESVKNVKQNKAQPNSQKSLKNTAKFLAEQQFTLDRTKLLKKQQKNSSPSVGDIGPLRSFQEVLSVNNSEVTSGRHSKQKNPLVPNMTLQQPSSTKAMPKPTAVPRDNTQQQNYLKTNNKQEIETNILQNKIFSLEKEMEAMRRKQNQIIASAASRVDSKELDFLRKRLESEQILKGKMEEEIRQLKSQIRKTKADFVRSKQEQASVNENLLNENRVHGSNISPRQSEVSRSSYKLRKINPKLATDNDLSDDRMSVSRSRIQPNILPIEQPLNINCFSARVDEDYNNNLTHFQKIGSWLNQKNQILFRLCVLGATEKFYEGQNLTIFKMQHLFTENDASFLKMTISLHFTKPQPIPPRVQYKNIAEVDFWTKPINGTERVFSQETIGRLCLVPMKIMKSTVHFDERGNNCTFLMPFLFYSFLQAQDFDAEQFGSIMESKHNQVAKSKVFYLDKSIAHTALDLSKIFKSSILSNQFLEMCLKQEGEEKVYMVQIQLLKNQRAVVRVLPIPYDSEMLVKAKELVANLTFLLSCSP